MKKFRTIVILLPVLLLFACKNPDLSSKKVELVNIYSGPVTTFNSKCSGCHGENGTNYKDDFSQLSDEDLSTKIKNMMEGPAQILAPSEDDLQVMIEYHRALRDKSLFLMVSNPVAFLGGYTTELKGNVTPGATVEIQKDLFVQTAIATNGEWMLKDIPKAPFTLLAKKDDQQTSFQFPDRQWNEIP